MSYLDDTVRDLRSSLMSLFCVVEEDHDGAAQEFLDIARAKILESFRNGQKSCTRCNPRKRRPNNRR